jgi:spermidine synthase
MAASAAGAIGITAGIGQIVLMREEVALFNGNELSVGIVLATWLLWTAAGSAFPHWFSELRIPLRLSIAIGACASGASLGLTIWGLREMRVQLQEIPGQSLSPVAIAFASLICLSVFCGLCGLQFSFAAKMYGLDCEVSDDLGTSYAYLYESAGFAAGALLTGIVLQPQLGSFQIAVVVCLLNICLAIWLMFPNMHTRVGLIAGAITFAIILIARVAPGMELATEAHLWKGFNITTIRESIYGRITILESGGVRSLFQNGVLLANAPDPASAEEVVHYALLEHPDPRKVMVIGGGTNGCLLEALKHPSLERIDYLELDPALIEVYRREFPTDWLNTFGDSRIHVHASDGRRFLNSSQEAFDVVIVNVSDPENAQINRFYTAEFLRTSASISLHKV